MKNTNTNHRTVKAITAATISVMALAAASIFAASAESENIKTATVYQQQNAVAASIQARLTGDRVEGAVSENAKHPGIAYIGAQKAEKAADEVAAVIKKSYAAEKEKADEEVNENGKHPGESGYQYYENEQAAKDAQADEEVNENGKHPGESGYQYYENEQAADEEEPCVDGKHPGEAGCHYVDENGKHPGEAGCNYAG